MVHIRLIKGRSYSGDINATSAKPDVYVDDEATANKAVASGFFKIISSAAPESPVAKVNEEPTPGGYGGKPLDEMNKSELETFATYRDVNIKGCKSKADIIDKLREALDPSELEGDIWYGSPTMQELQKE